MGWTVEISDVAEGQLRKLDRPVQKCLFDGLDDRIEGCKNPRHFGEPLRGDLAGRGAIGSVITASSAKSRMNGSCSWLWR